MTTLTKTQTRFDVRNLVLWTAQILTAAMFFFAGAHKFGNDPAMVGLFDAILIKDNHVRLAGGVAAAIGRMRAERPDLPVEVEVQTLAEVDEALHAGAERLLVDNMSIADVRESVRRARASGRAQVEISGGVTLARMSDLAATGADYVSVGALTHSAPAVDISFEIEPLEMPLAAPHP